MSSTDRDDHIRLSNEILESRRRTRLSRAIATIGFAAGAALTGGVVTGAWLYFLGFFALITVGVAVGNGISGAVDRGDPTRLLHPGSGQCGSTGNHHLPRVLRPFVRDPDLHHRSYRLNPRRNGCPAFDFYGLSMLFGFNLEISVTKRSRPLGKKEFSHDEHRQHRHTGRRGFEPRNLAAPRIRCGIFRRRAASNPLPAVSTPRSPSACPSLRCNPTRLTPVDLRTPKASAAPSNAPHRSTPHSPPFHLMSYPLRPLRRSREQ